METRELKKDMYLKKSIDTYVASRIKELMKNTSANVYLDTHPNHGPPNEYIELHPEEGPVEKYKAERYKKLHSTVFEYWGTEGGKNVQLIVLPRKDLRPPKDKELLNKLEAILTSNE